MERSLHSSRFVFVEHARRQCHLSGPERAVLSRWFDFLIDEGEIDTAVDLFVYLRTSPEIAFERMRSRNRPEERNVTIDYLREIHDLHEEWLYANSSNQAVLIVNGNQDLRQHPSLIDEILGRINRRSEEIRESDLDDDSGLFADPEPELVAHF